MKLVAVDPGVSNGFALRLAPGQYATATYRKLPDVWDLLKQAKPAAVAVENFYTGGRVNEYSIHTIEAVGSLLGVCHTLGVPCFRQQPQERRSFILDAKRLFRVTHGRMPIMTKDEDDHEISALAHLLLLESRIDTGRYKL